MVIKHKDIKDHCINTISYGCPCSISRQTKEFKEIREFIEHPGNHAARRSTGEK